MVLATPDPPPLLPATALNRRPSVPPGWTIGEEGGDRMDLSGGSGGQLLVEGVIDCGSGVSEAKRLEGNWSWVLMAVVAEGGPVGREDEPANGTVDARVVGIDDKVVATLVAVATLAAAAAFDFFWFSSSSGLEGGVIWLAGVLGSAPGRVVDAVVPTTCPLAANRVATRVLTAGLLDTPAGMGIG